MISGSLALLAKSANIAHTETLQVWDRASNSYAAWAKGRLHPYDRFKSIYHRPVQRETLAVPAGTALPASLVLKVPSSGTLFAISTTPKQDAVFDSVFDLAIALHRVSPGTVRRPAVTGTGDNLGAVVLQSMGTQHFGVELHTLKGDEYLAVDQTGVYLLTTTFERQLQDGDLLTLDGVEYEVQEAYNDSGFQAMKALQHVEPYEDMVYELATTGGGYNPTTGVVGSSVIANRAFSGVVKVVVSESGPDTFSKEIEVFVRTQHVGFSFKDNGTIRRGSDKYRIRSIGQSMDRKQWRIRADRVPM